MTTGSITFPNLGIDINPSRVAFTVLGKDVYWYGIIIAVGFILAVIYAMRRAPKFGLTEDHVLDMLFFAVPAAIICARAYYCIFNWELYRDDPVSVFYIWKGGIAIYGGVIGAVATVLIFCKVRKIPTGPLLDVGGLGLFIGQMIGRWGNFINREAYGVETDSFLKMGIKTGSFVKYYHPTFLYESLWNLVGFVCLHLYSKRRKFDGECFALYVAWYGLGRAWIEGLRTDSLYLFGTGIRVSQLVAILSCLAAAAYIVWRRTRKAEDVLYVVRVAARSAEETVDDAAEEFSEEIMDDAVEVLPEESVEEPAEET